MNAPVSLQDRISALLRPVDPFPAHGQNCILGGPTFGQIRRMAADLRGHFSSQNKREYACLATENKAVFAAALLASLAGGPILLLPFACSPQALSEMQAATGYRTLISDQPREAPPGTRLVTPAQSQNTDPDTLVDLSASPLDLGEELLCLYTGGSTGAPQIWPKTVVNIMGEGLFLASHFQVSLQDRIVATVSPYHIYGLLYSVVLPLMSGAAVWGSCPSFPEEIVHSARENQASLLISVPPHYRALNGKPCLGAQLRLAFSSAGTLDVEDNLAFSQKNACGIIEVYGSTETGGVGLRNRSQGEEGFAPYPVIDWEITRQRLHIDSPYLSPNLPRDGQGRFVTGDLVEACNSKKSFLLKGRADSITKVAGKRVDLEEIRKLIKAQTGVRDCLVLALDEAGGREHRIVALVEGKDIRAEALLRVLAARLEPYALPRAIKIVERMPIKENGKYDRPLILRLLQ